MRTPRPARDRASSDLQAVQVFCRVKPNLTNSASCVEVIDNVTLKTTGTRGGSQKETLHTFTGVYDETASQDELFQNVALPLISEFIEGKNGLLLTYGTTGSGKTFAMQGTTKEAGILPLTLDVIFNSIGCRQTKKYVVKPDGLNGFLVQSESDAIMDRHRLDYQQRLRNPRTDVPAPTVRNARTSISVDVGDDALYAVFISLVEVYNNNIYDLLCEATDPVSKQLPTHVLREDAQRNIYVAGCVEVEVKSAEDAVRIFANGRKRRRVGQTALNSESSRSHCVFTIRLVRTGYDGRYDEAIEDKDLLTVSQLCMVDLAGSERANRAGTHGDRLKEASYINNSLMNLRKCIEVLREIQSAGHGPLGLATPGGSMRVVPYRDRRLTHLFKNFFEGNGRVVILVCILQSVEDYEETMHVLKFAETSQEVATFRTPVLPARSPAPTNRRVRYMQPIGSSDHSTSSSDTTFSMPATDDQLNTLLQELNNYGAEIDGYLDRLLTHNSELDADLEKENIPPLFDSEDSENVPECDQHRRSAQKRERKLAPVKSFRGYRLDLEPLRALLTHRLECRQRAYGALEREVSVFRTYLTEVIQTDSSSKMGLDLDSNERNKLMSRIRLLEGQVIENSASTKRERTEKLRLVEEYQQEIDRLQSELKRVAGTARSSLSGKNTRNRRPRPSMLPQTAVSTLSKQWEARLAQQNSSAVKARGKQTAVVPRRVAAFNPRHRRSRSAGADTSRWLEHQEITAAPLGTVFTPSLKRRKSVTQIELKDTLKATNYLLHHQEATPDGNVETKLYKGTIIPTAGGGSSVIFDDVEHLRQTSPLSVKRTPEEDETAEYGVGGSSDESQRSKRRRTSSRLSARRSFSSIATDDSAKTSASTSSYRPMSPLMPPPILNNHLGSDEIASRCQIGVSHTGSVERRVSFARSKSRK